MRSELHGTVADEEYPVEVLRSDTIDGATWFEVEVLNGSPCFVDEIRALTRGWVPAYGTGGKPLVWYYSRGC